VLKTTKAAHREHRGVVTSAVSTPTRQRNRVAPEPDDDPEIEGLRREIAELRARIEADGEAKRKLGRLAIFPEENPNPVIEFDFEGRATYLNPAAQARFPELWELNANHPLMRDLVFPFVARPGEARTYVVREIQVGEAVYEQKVCYIADADGNHIRVYVHDITRRKRAEETNQELLKRLVHAHEEERQRVSRELHDEAGQALTALKLSLELIQGDIPREAESVRVNLTEAIHLTEATKEQIRMLARGLRPPALDALGLNLTLESFCRDFARRTQLAIAYKGEEIPGLPDVANMCLYRTLQEALANVAKHAGASSVNVRLQRDAEHVRLVVEDNGSGPGKAGRRAASKRGGGIGLIGLKERLDLFGGGLDIDKGAAGGLRLSAHLPLRAAKDGE
jgi:signal transduction histidine kinase